MQLQRQLSRKHKGKEYPKYTVVIPPKEIEKLGWKNGAKIRSQIRGKKLILETEE